MNRGADPRSAADAPVGLLEYWRLAGLGRPARTRGSRPTIRAKRLPPRQELAALLMTVPLISSRLHFGEAPA
jgi:hypothetical protein